jgi:hypothetical protein
VPAPSGLEEALAWARWASDEDLDWLEGLASRCVHLDHEPTQQEQAKWLSIEADAIVRMLAGEPDVIEQGRREREADVLEQRRRGKALWLGYDPRTDPIYEGRS